MRRFCYFFPSLSGEMLCGFNCNVGTDIFFPASLVNWILFYVAKGNVFVYLVHMNQMVLCVPGLN